MFTSLRSALLICAVLSASSVGPAQAGPTNEPVQVASMSLPRIATPDIMIGDEVTAPSNLSDDQIAPVDGDEDGITDQILQDQPGQATADRPIDRSAGLDSMVASLRSSTPGSRELECLAVGVYFESKSEPLLGQLAVGKVIANRAASKRFPPSYCGVLFQRSQFSFVRGNSLPPVARGGRQWQNAVAIAKIVDRGLKSSAAENALFFHAKRVSPGWHLTRVASIGNHIFYR